VRFIGVVPVKTDELIIILSKDCLPRERLWPNFALGAAVGTLVAATLFFGAVGFRPDIAQAVRTIRFLFKFVVTISLAVTAVQASLRLSRPDEDFRSSTALLVAPILLACAVGIELLVLPSGQWISKLIGHNARTCLTLIPLLSIGPLTCFMIVLRHGAPSNPGWTGAAAGLAASGIAATFYASNCNDDSPLFVATWYPIAILAVSTAGYLIGRRALKW
jgi:hypothetical protein